MKGTEMKTWMQFSIVWVAVIMSTMLAFSVHAGSPSFTVDETKTATTAPAPQPQNEEPLPARLPMTPIKQSGIPGVTAPPSASTSTKAPATTHKSNEPDPIPVGRVVWVKGDFIAERPDKTQRALKKSSIVFVSDTLMTDAKSQAQIVFTDTSLMTFRQDTKFIIKDYEYKPENKDKGSVGKYAMDLVKGGFRTITGMIPKSNPDDYKVKTPVATIGVRGTEYDTNGEVLAVGYGAVSMNGTVAQAGSGLHVQPNGRVAVITAAQAASILGPAPVIVAAQAGKITRAEIEKELHGNDTSSSDDGSFCIK